MSSHNGDASALPAKLEVSLPNSAGYRSKPSRKESDSVYSPTIAIVIKWLTNAVIYFLGTAVSTAGSTSGHGVNGQQEGFHH